MKPPLSDAEVEQSSVARAQTARTPQPRANTREQIRDAEWGATAALMALMVPTFVTMLNNGMIGVALPSIRDSFNASVDLVAWVVTIYTLPYVIMMPLYGRMGDAFGKRRLFLVGVIVFLIGTGVNLLAINLPMLMVGRAIQGVGSAGIIPLSMAIIAELFPINERGKALGTWNSIGPMTGMVGPLLSGLMIDTLGWQSIFAPVLLVGVTAPFIVRGRVPATRGTARFGSLRTFDWTGVVLLATAATALLLYVNSEQVTGVLPLQDWRLLVATLLGFTIFVLWERRQQEPFVALDIFSDRSFSVASICSGLRMFTMSCIGFAIPLYLVDVRALSSVGIGMMLLFHSGALLITMRLGGQLADRLGGRRPVILGMLVQVSAMALFALLPGTVSILLVVLALATHGLGAGLALAPLHRAAMGKVPSEQMGIAAGVYSMVRFAGTILGTALAGVVLHRGLERALLPIEAYHTVFWFFAVVSLLGVIVGALLRDE